MATKTIIFLIAMAIASTLAQADYNDKSEIMAKIQQIDFSNDRNKSTIKITTDDPHHQFRYLPANGNGCFSFRVKVSDDAHISLSNAAIYTDPKYWIVIGGWGNTHSGIVINCDADNPAIKTNTPAILSNDEYRGFWVRWSQQGDILVGKANELFPFIMYKHPIEKWFPINFIGVKTVSKTTGHWIVDEIPSCPYM